MDATVRDRLKLRFDILDLDGDGQLEAEDFESLARRLVDTFGLADDSPKARTVLDTHTEYWRQMMSALDRDRDGRVSFDEYLEIVHKSQALLPAAQARADAVDALLDVDGDGRITRKDFLAGMRAVGFIPADSASIFERLDTDSDGFISAGEFAALTMEFYASEDTGSVTNLHLRPQSAAT